MKIAIIADTHDNLANLRKVVNLLKKEKIKLLIHCGDIFKPETIKEGLRDFKGKIYIIFSSADADFSKLPYHSFKDIPRLKIYEEFGEVKIGGKKIAFCHFPETAENLVEGQEYDFVFYGHTHRPWIKRIKKTRLVNPGNLCGIFYKPTFAVYDTKTDKLELKILDPVVKF